MANKSTGTLRYREDGRGGLLLCADFPKKAVGEGLLDGKSFLACLVYPDGSRKTFPVFRQNAGLYGDYSEYMRRHGCACCSLTAVLAAYVPELSGLTPERTIAEVERRVFPANVWARNYKRHIARQMPPSLYGIAQVLAHYGVPHRYVGAFRDGEALREIRAHLKEGKPVVIETSRMRRKNGRIVRWFDRRFAGSYHTMILLGMAPGGEAVFTDSADRAWAGRQQRLKRARLEELINYMFPQKNTRDKHCYFSRRRNTGGYILLG